MQHQEMIHPTDFGVISRTCLFSLVGIVAVFIIL